MKKAFRLRIVNPERTIYDGDAAMIIVRATTGELGILPGHAPLTALLAARPVRIMGGEGETTVPITGGLMKVRPENVTIVTTV